MNSKSLFATLCLMLLAAGCSQQTSQSPSKEAAQGNPAQARQPGKSFDIKLVSVARVKEWQATEGGSVHLTKGVAMKMIGGSLNGFEAETGYEIAVVKLTVNRMADGASASLDDVSVVDDKDKKYSSIVGQLSPLGKEKTENREFAFAVPAGTALKKIELAKDVSVDLK